MGKRGPPPTPTSVLLMRGSWRGSARKNEPQPDRSRPSCPKWLKPDGKALWRSLVRELESMGVLGHCDATALARYCQMFAQWRECQTFMELHGATFTSKDGVEMPYPQSATALRLSEQMLRLEQQFGLTPAARAGLSSQVAKSQASEKSRFFKAASGA